MDTKRLKRSTYIKSSEKIARIFKEGKRVYGNILNLYYLPAEEEAFAVLVRKKSGKAFQRNKVKRWIREIYRTEKSHLPLSCELVILSEKHFANINFSKLKEEILRLFAKLKPNV